MLTSGHEWQQSAQALRASSDQNLTQLLGERAFRAFRQRGGNAVIWNADGSQQIIYQDFSFR